MLSILGEASRTIKKTNPSYTSSRFFTCLSGTFQGNRALWCQIRTSWQERRLLGVRSLPYSISFASFSVVDLWHSAENCFRPAEGIIGQGRP